MADTRVPPEPSGRPLSAQKTIGPVGPSGRLQRLATTIRVVDVRRATVDLVTASQEELSLALAAIENERPPTDAAGWAPLGPTGSPSENIGAREDPFPSLSAFLDLAQSIQGPLALLFTPLPTSPAVLIRELLVANPAVVPVVGARVTLGAGPESKHEGVLARAASRTRAIDGATGGSSAVAAEEPFLLSALAVDPLAIGSMMGRESKPPLDHETYALCGMYTTALLAATGPVRIPEAPEASKMRWGFSVVDVTSAEVLMRQARAAMEFYLGGAAAATALAHVAAAVEGVSGAPPGLLSVLGPVQDVFTGMEEKPLVVRNTGPTWRGPVAEERLRYLLGALAKTELLAADAPEKLAWAYDMSPLDDLYRVGAFPAYLLVLTEGRESERLEAYLEQVGMRHAKAVQLAAVARGAVLAAARARMYVLIAEDKFGSSRAVALLDALRVSAGLRAHGAPGGRLADPTASVQADDPGAVLALLSKQERTVVETEYASQLAAWEAEGKNKCPHVQLARKIRSARRAEDARRFLQSLEKFMPPSKGPTKGSAGKTSSEPDTEWIKCLVCGGRVVCPHVRDLARLEARRAPFGEVQAQLMKYAVRIAAPSSGSLGTGSATYFCRVCSERLGETEEDRTAEVLGRFGDLDAGLRTKIWTTALHLAAAVRFPMPTDERQFATVAANVVYPLLMSAEETLSKKGQRRRAVARPSAEGTADGRGRAAARRTRDASTDPDIDPRTQLYIILFVYAYVLDLIKESRGLSGREIGFADVRPGSRENVYADRMLQRIAETHRSLLAQIEDITAEYLRDRFTEAYKMVRGEGASGLETAKPEEELASQTVIDPIYRYAATAARIAGSLPLDRPAGPVEARREFETVLGASIPALVKIARESARDPVLAPLYLRRIGTVVPPGGLLEHLLKNPRVNLYARLYEAPPTAKADLAAFAVSGGGPNADGSEADQSGFSLADAIVPVAGGKAAHRHKKANGVREPSNQDLKKYRTPWTFVRPSLAINSGAERARFFEAYRLFVTYTKGITSQEAYDTYLGALTDYRRHERRLLDARAQRAQFSYYDLLHTRTQQFAGGTVALTYLYDESGARHVWQTYVYGGGAAGPEVVVSGGPWKGGPRLGQSEAVDDAKLIAETAGKAVAKARETGVLPPGLTLTDMECVVCGVRASKTNELDPVKTAQSVRIRGKIDSFYAFYTERCPEGDLHDYSRGACAKCGLGPETQTRPERARGYYDKYAAVFRTAAASSAVPLQKEPAPLRAQGPSRADTNWQPDYTLVVQAAELAGVSTATIEAIGATAGREYADVIEGRGAPPPPTARSDPRIYAADADVRLFLADYGALRHAAAYVRVPPSVAALLDAAQVPRHEYARLSTLLPDLEADKYRATLAFLLKERPAADALTFAIQSLCKMVLIVAAVAAVAAVATTNKQNPKEETDEVQLSWLVRISSMFAKNELTLILRGHRLLSKPGNFDWSVFEAGDGDENDPQLDVAADVGEDVLEEALATDREEAPEDPFSEEHIDYDTSENNFDKEDTS
jgi:hypothetical protein